MAKSHKSCMEQEAIIDTFGTYHFCLTTQMYLSFTYINEAFHGSEEVPSKHYISLICLHDGKVNFYAPFKKHDLDIFYSSLDLRNIPIRMFMERWKFVHACKVQRIINKAWHYRNHRSNITKSKEVLIRDNNPNKRLPVIFYFQNLLSRRIWFFYSF